MLAPIFLLTTIISDNMVYMTKQAKPTRTFSYFNSLKRSEKHQTQVCGRFYGDVAIIPADKWLLRPTQI